MANKTNIIQKATDYINETASNAALNLGLVVMTAAAVTAAVEMPHDPNEKRVVLPTNNHSNVAPHEDSKHGNGSEGHSEERKEEPRPHHISYGASQRTPARSSK